MPRCKFLMAFLTGLVLTSAQVAWAGAVITYHGRILDSADRPVESSAVTFRIRIYSPNPGKCLLYEESRTVSMANSNGIFVIPIGDGVGNRSATTDPGISMEEIFSNNPNVTLNRTDYPKFTCNTAGHSYTANSLDQRQLLVSFDDNSGAGEQILPLTDIGFVPLAVSAYDSQKVGGTAATSLVRLSSGTATPISSAQYSELLNLISGSSTQYSKSNQLNGSTIPALTAGQSLTWNGSNWIGATAGGSGDITDVVAGTGLSGGGTSGSVTLNLSSVGTAGDYYKVTTDASGRVTAGQASLLAADIPALATSKITSGTFADAFLAGISIDKLINGTGKYFNYKPNNVACAAGEILKYDPTLNASAGGWKCATESGVGSESDPTVAAYAKNAPSTGLVVNGSNQLTVDVGTTGTKIVQLTGGKLPAVDGSNLTNLPAGASFSGSLAGDVTGTQSATVVSRINGIAASSAVAGDDTKYLKYVHGSGWQPHFVKLSELKNGTGTASAFNAGIAGCTAAQTLTWSSITDQMNCQAINGIPAANVTGLATAATSGNYNDLSNLPTLGSLAAKSAVSLTADVGGILPIANGGTGANSVAQNLFFAGPTGSTGAPSFRTIASADLPASVKYWDAATGGINYGGGNIGIGTTTPQAKLHLAGNSDVVTDGTTPFYISRTTTYPTSTSEHGGLAFVSEDSAASTTIWPPVASVSFNPTETHTASTKGTSIYFYTTPNGSTNRGFVAIMDQNGNMGVGTTNTTDKLTVGGTVKANTVRLAWTNKTNLNTGGTLTSGNYFLDVSGGPITLTLPAAPKHGETIKFVHAAGNLSTNNVTLTAGAGDTIVGDATLIMDINHGSIELIFYDLNEDGDGDWRIM